MPIKPNEPTPQTAAWQNSDTSLRTTTTVGGLARLPADTVAGELRKRIDELFVHDGAAPRGPSAALRRHSPAGATDDLASALVALETAESEAVYRLALIAELRDNRTAAHIHRVSAYCALLARAIGLSDAEVHLIARAAPLHDLGKLTVPTEILSKPGPLTAEEWEAMKQHPGMGASLLAGSPLRLLSAAETIAVSHHERWDGSGYPHGLTGDAIPLSGRICAIADVFDALVSERPYKPAYSIDTALKVLKEGRGSHFDPKLIDTFLQCTPEAVDISLGQGRMVPGTAFMATAKHRSDARRARTYH
jgi:HD-GYP domain-containing protein (c-di-GMP phosphodiesterase class II)